MPRRAATFLVVWLSVLVGLVAACGPAAPPPAQNGPQPAPVAQVAVPSPPAQAAQVAGSEDVIEEPGAEDGGDPGPIPVTRADPVRGSRSALVTLVVFSDFECPFCKKLHATLRELQGRYGPDQVRIVWKNNPLPFHKNARPASEAAAAVYEHRGPRAFWTFHDAIFESLDRLSPEQMDQALQAAGVNPRSLGALLESGSAGRKVDDDMALGKRIGVTGTPASFINGVFLSGAQPIDKFVEIVDAQLAAARALRERGTPPSRVYPTLAQQNFKAPKPPDAHDDDDDDADTAVHLVPIGDSPVRGKATALVTLVEFADFQCPFCGRVAPTVDQLIGRYGDDLRVVWKDQPLPFHPRAEPAAELAREARAQKGDAAFWKASTLLFDNQRDLSDTALEGIATTLQLNLGAVQRAIATRKYAAKITADQDLADDIQASGTPHFFINGRRLVGAQPIEKFQRVIDEELAKAKALVAKGTPPAKVYDAIMKQAAPPQALPKLNVPAPGKSAPRRGAAGGKVVVQVFADFQCPFCQRSVKTMDDLIAAFPGQVQVVWRNMPLPMHPQAQIAAEAALEAYAQKGDAGFWKMHDLLFQDTSEQNLNRAAVERHAALMGLDLAKLRAALDAGTHRAAIEADRKVADAAGISGTPAFVINGIHVSGAQPLAKFKKAVKQALAEGAGKPKK